MVLAALPAFLLEATLFLTLGVESWRKRLEKLRPAGVAALLVLGADRPLLRRFAGVRIVSLAIAGRNRAAGRTGVLLVRRAAAEARRRTCCCSR